MDRTTHNANRPRLALVASHPVQYQAPWYRALARELDLHVFYCHRQSAQQQSQAGYGVAFDWDTDLLSGYEHSFLENVARDPGVYRFAQCDTPGIYEALGKGRFDAVVVLGWYLKSFLQTLHAGRRHSLPVLARGDSQLASPRTLVARAAKQVLHRGLFRYYSGFLSVGQRNREYLRHYGVPDERIFFVPHFVNRALFSEGATSARRSRDALRRAAGIDGAAKLALFVGRFVDFKRPLDLVRALARLPAKGPRVEAAFVGSGPLSGAIEAEARRVGVRVHLLGFKNQSELPSSYALGDFLVLPSSGAETWGLVVNEAMASGLPCVVSDSVGSAPDLIAPDQTGYRFACGDLDGLAAAMHRAVELAAREATPAALARKLDGYDCVQAVGGTVDAVRAAMAAG